MPRALMITGDAAEDLDAMYPLYRLREAGWDVDVAALTRRPVQLVVHDFDEGYDAYSEKPGRRLPVDFTFGEVEVERELPAAQQVHGAGGVEEGGQLGETVAAAGRHDGGELGPCVCGERPRAHRSVPSSASSRRLSRVPDGP